MAAETATSSLPYTPGAGRGYVDLTSWAGDATFTVTPVAGDQIESADTLTLNADGTVTGPDGTYTLRHVQATGSTEAISYSITDTTAPVLTNLVATDTDPDTIDVSVDTDEADGTLYVYASANASEVAADIKTNAQGSQAVSATGTQSLTLTLATGTYYVHVMHEDAAVNQSAVLSSVQITLGESATTTLPLAGGATYTVATLAAGFETYVFEQWPATEPAVGWQLVTLTADGAYFDSQGNWHDAAAGIYDVWVIDLAGTIYKQTVDSTALPTLLTGTITLDPPTVGKTSITQPFSYDGTDATGFEYQVDNGAWVATSSPAQITGLNPGTLYSVSIRATAPSGFSAATSSNITTDSGVDTAPTPFSFTAQSNVARSITVTSNAIQVMDVDPGVDVPVTVAGDLGSEYSVSTDGGVTYGGWTSAPTNVRLNYRIRVRHTSSNEYSSGGYDGVRETTLTVGGVSGTFTSTTLADATAPVITLTGGNQTVVQGQPWVEPGYSAIDNADGDISVTGVVITGSVDTSTPGEYILTYTATDASGNVASTTRTVTVVEFVPDDTTAPVISLTGGNRTLTVGDTWAEPGYSATDDTDGNLTAQVQIAGSVNTAAAGTYTLTYSVADSTGNVGTATRIVTVLPATQYPFDVAAPAKRTFDAKRLSTQLAVESLTLMQTGEVLDFDFDLTTWLSEQGDDIAEGTYTVAELADELEVLAVGPVPNTDRIKVWLRCGAVKDSVSSLVQLTVTTTGYRTGVFQFRTLLINRMQ